MPQFLDDRLPARFWNYVIPDPMGGCWLWTAYLNRGYGMFMIAKRPHLAHRLAYEALVGPIPKELHIDHLCRVRCCCNPDHLEPVTPYENYRRGMGRMVNLNKTHCPQGHEYSDDNTITIMHPYGGKGRACRICKNARAVQKRAADRKAS